MYWTLSAFLCVCVLVRGQVIPGKSRTNEGDFNNVNTDGSFDFGYANKDDGSSYHLAHGNANRVVGGRFGSRDPASGTVKETIYTAGPRGFRAKGPNVHRQMDLDQRPRGPIGNKDDPYFDPNEDPSYAFNFNTRTYSKNENADSRGDVKGHYSFVDDAGERHEVSYIAGRDTGFHVSSAHPDAPNVIGSPFHLSPLVKGETRPRGRTAVQRGLDGSYRFISAGPDQRRTESSDSHGNVRGSYTFLDDKGVQRTVHYIAGPNIGYRIVKNSKDPYIPPFFPTIPSAYDPDFVKAGSKGYAGVPGPPQETEANRDDVFKGPDGTAASGHVKPPPYLNDKDRSNKNSGDISLTSVQVDSNEVIADSSYNQGSNYKPNSADEVIYGDEDASSFQGVQPTVTPGKPRRPNKPFRPAKKPYVPLKPFSGNRKSNDADYEPYRGPTPNSRENDNSGDYQPFNGPTRNSNSGEREYEIKKIDDNGPEYGVGYDVQQSKPESTVITNVGEDYFGVPPGVSVRAHVQSIDLYPFGSKPISPSEALENDKT